MAEGRVTRQEKSTG